MRESHMRGCLWNFRARKSSQAPHVIVCTWNSRLGSVPEREFISHELYSQSLQSRSLASFTISCLPILPAPSGAPAGASSRVETGPSGNFSVSCFLACSVVVLSIGWKMSAEIGSILGLLCRPQGISCLILQCIYWSIFSSSGLYNVLRSRHVFLRSDWCI